MGACINDDAGDSARDARQRVVLERMLRAVAPGESDDSFASLSVAAVGDREDPRCVGFALCQRGAWGNRSDEQESGSATMARECESDREGVHNVDQCANEILPQSDDAAASRIKIVSKPLSASFASCASWLTQSNSKKVSIKDRLYCVLA